MSDYWDALDLLDPPRKQRQMRVTTTATYLVWVDDDEGVGAERLAQHWGDPSDLSDLIKNESAVDGDITIAAPDQWDRILSPQYGPWQQCPFPGCQTVQYPAYVDPTCWKHRVTGCQHRNLPERTAW